jgi:hypothetical protein
MGILFCLEIPEITWTDEELLVSAIDYTCF